MEGRQALIMRIIIFPHNPGNIGTGPNYDIF